MKKQHKLKRYKVYPNTIVLFRPTKRLTGSVQFINGQPQEPIKHKCCAIQ